MEIKLYVTNIIIKI